MKYALIALLVLFFPIVVFAQKKKPAVKSTSRNRSVEIPVAEKSLYVDIGSAPGLSVTYNRRITKHWGVGMGIQAYSIYPSYTDNRAFVPGVFGDIHFNIRPLKKHQFFSFLDLGMNFYKQDKNYFRDSTTVYYAPHNNGFYSGLGVGYFLRMTKRGGGPYVSLKAVFNWYTVRVYSIVSEEDDKVLSAAAIVPVISLGFKF